LRYCRSPEMKPASLVLTLGWAARLVLNRRRF